MMNNSIIIYRVGKQKYGISEALAVINRLSNSEDVEREREDEGMQKRPAVAELLHAATPSPG